MMAILHCKNGCLRGAANETAGIGTWWMGNHEEQWVNMMDEKHPFRRLVILRSEDYARRELEC